MTNAELIKALRYCISENADDCDLCPYQIDCKSNGTGKDKMIRDAADALESADEKIADYTAAIDALDDSNDAYIKENERLKKRIEEMEKQMPKEGEWIEDEYGYIHCSRCGMEGYPKTKFCPNCGAKMKGGQNEREN